MRSPRDGRAGAVHTRRRCSGVPLLSCAVVLLLPAPALAASAAPTASAPGARTAPRAVAPYGTPPSDGRWGERLSQRLADVLGEHPRSPHAPYPRHHPRDPGDPHHPRHAHDGREGTPPLPPLFGPHEHAWTGSPATRARSGGQPVAGTDASGPWQHRSPGEAAGGHAHPHPGPASPTREPGATLQDAEPGGTGPAGARRADGPAPADTGRAGASPGGLRARAGTGTEATGQAVEDPAAPAQGGMWSPAPVAPQDTVAGAADPGRPQAGPPRQSPAGDGAAEAAAPAAAAAPAGPILPVLPLGAGLTCLGLGLAFLALRLRRG
ncbi:hypothetical protein RM572_09650 [Streptomyces sp. DSM 42041]|uniref:Uncharacterized protein n=1 Tax=Streptomyces hazeniae TaxID=3075538 RepID=A0ABU2NPX7_9ACTN|nr:hypothetical protein [Streptomyces sp. DSM 42041]MDT0379034.1 hypothetical protein [Streptomyces sp. DSM 42041]